MSRDHAIYQWAEKNGVTLQLVRVNHADDKNGPNNKDGSVFRKAGGKENHWLHRHYLAILSIGRDDLGAYPGKSGPNERLRDRADVLITDYSAGTGIKKSAIDDGITVADVLVSLAHDAQTGGESFAEFCANYGPDDAVEARRMWKACRRQHKKLLAWLGSEAKLEELQKAAEDY